jgi:hypothetical protein
MVNDTTLIVVPAIVIWRTPVTMVWTSTVQVEVIAPLWIVHGYETCQVRPSVRSHGRVRRYGFRWHSRRSLITVVRYSPLGSVTKLLTVLCCPNRSEIDTLSPLG